MNVDIIETLSNQVAAMNLYANADEFTPDISVSNNGPVTRGRPILPTVSGKPKKSTVNKDHPDIELLNSQIVILMSKLSLKDLELKKVLESDDLKRKRIVQLESQLKSAQNLLLNSSKNIHETPDKDNSNTRVDNLEANVYLIKGMVLISPIH